MSLLNAREASGWVKPGDGLGKSVFEARLSFHYIVAMQVNK